MISLQKKWYRFCLFLLSLYYVISYIDPDLYKYLCNCGPFGDLGPQETSQFISPEIVSLFNPTGTYIFIAVGILSAIFLNSKRFLGVAVISTLFIQCVVLLRSPSYYVIHRPFIGVLTAFLPFLIKEPDRKHFGLTVVDWMWWMSGVVYLSSGLSKLNESHWIAGSAISNLSGFPLRSTILVYLSQFPWVSIGLTYSAIFLEFGYGFLSFFKRTRFAAWIMIFILHLGILVLLQIYVATLPMILFHLFQFDVSWFAKKEASVR